MENKKITPPEGYKFEVISETEIKLVPVETKHKYPTKIEEIKRDWNIDAETFTTYSFSKEGLNTYDAHCASEATAIKFAAMMQLIEFRDAWNKIDGFVADWGNYSQMKIFIGKKESRNYIDYSYSFSRPLNFGSQETAELFLNTHRALIEQAGDLV